MERAIALLLASVCALGGAAHAAPSSSGAARLGEELAAEDPVQRLHAARELVALDADSALPLVKIALDDRSLDVQIAAVSAAGQLGLDELFRALIERAASPQATLREASIEALHALARDVGRRRAIDAEPQRAIAAALARAVGDPEIAVRMAALRALANRATDTMERATTVEAIAGALADEHPDLRRAAADALAHLGDVQAVQALAAHVDDTSPEVRLAIARALGTLGDPRVAPSVLRLTDDTNPDVREAAIASLGLLRAESAVPRLVPILSHPRDPLVGLAAIALGRIAEGPTDVEKAAHEDSTTTTLRARAGHALVAGTRRPENRAATLEGFRAAGRAAAGLLRDLLPAIGPRPADDVLLVAADLAAGGDEGTTALLLGLVGLAADGRFDAALTRARPPAGPTRAALVAWLAGRLGDKGAAARRAAATSLGALADPRAARALEAAVGDADEGVRKAALLALAATTGASAPLLLSAARSGDPELVRAALGALGRRHDEAARQALVIAIGGSDPIAQRVAALGLADDPGAVAQVAPLLALMKAGPAASREAAALALLGPLRGKPDAVARELCLPLVTSDDPAASGALELVGAMRDPASFDRLRLALPRLGGKPVRRARLYAALGDLLLGGNAPSFEIERVLAGGLADAEPAVRASVAWALGKGTPRGAAKDPVIDALLARLADPSGAVRANALGALARLHRPPTAAALARLARDPELAVRANALRLGALRDSDRAQTLPLLSRAATYSGAAIGRGAAFLLLRLVDDAAIGTRTAGARIGLADGLVEVAPADERGMLRDDGVPSGDLIVDVDPAVLR